MYISQVTDQRILVQSLDHIPRKERWHTLRANVHVQSEHLKLRSFVWIAWCRFISNCRLKVVGHIGHLNFLFPLDDVDFRRPFRRFLDWTGSFPPNWELSLLSSSSSYSEDPVCEESRLFEEVTSRWWSLTTLSLRYNPFPSCPDPWSTESFSCRLFSRASIAARDIWASSSKLDRRFARSVGWYNVPGTNDWPELLAGKGVRSAGSVDCGWFWLNRLEVWCAGCPKLEAILRWLPGIRRGWKWRESAKPPLVVRLGPRSGWKAVLWLTLALFE